MLQIKKVFKLTCNINTNLILIVFYILEKENKEINQFAGIYAIKSVFYDTNVSIPKAHSAKDDGSNKPKLIELYQYPGYEKDSLTPLAHNMKIENILEKVINSILILNKQVSWFYKFLSVDRG